MESLHKLEGTIAQWFKDVPHLPQGGRVWLFENVWWIALIGAIVGAVTVLPGLFVLFGAGALVAIFAGPIVTTLSGIFFFASILSLAFLVAISVITGLAVQPLKDQEKKGWDYLFLAVTLGIVSNVANIILTVSLSGLLGALISALVGLYFLYEIREYYEVKVSKKSPKPKAATLASDEKTEKA